MTERERVMSTLSAQRTDLLRFGVRRLGVFGSVARDETSTGSDVDLLVEFGEGQETFDNFMGLALHLEALLGRKIDLATPEMIRPEIRLSVERDLAYL